jgi:tetratricopeptide (TPR) repeat protein
MARHRQLDAARRTRIGQVTGLLIVLLITSSRVSAQESGPDTARFAAAQKAYDDGQWDQAEKLATGPINQPPNFDFLRGLALARLSQWEGARQAFEAGHQKAPRDPRFLVELAGVAYKQQDLSAAKRELHAALLLNAKDAYSLEFLGTIYFLQGNLEAALKYWNLAGKPRLNNVAFSPLVRLGETLRDRAIAFNAPQILTRDALATTEARLDNLGIFANRRIELAPAASGNYDLTLHLAERDGWGESNVSGLLALLRGLLYATVYPEFFNLGHGAMNFTSLVRWDDQKRRVFAALSTPLFHDPSLSFRVYFDARNENWNLSENLFVTGAPLANLNLRRIAGGGELRGVVDGNWSWSTGLEVSNRSFRNLPGQMSGSERNFFTDTTGFASWLRGERILLNAPERRFTVNSSAEARVGRDFASGLGPSGTLKTSLRANWLPRAQGDDYEVETQLRAGGTAGKVPLDELFQLGIERDNDLWLRGHAGTTDGRKGAAPLGRRYLLVNGELDKYIFKGAFFTIKLGPFVDSGAIADSSGMFGSQKWLWDVGGQCKVRILGSVTVLLSYGRDLRSGRGVFYATTLPK